MRKFFKGIFCREINFFSNGLRSCLKELLVQVEDGIQEWVSSQNEIWRENNSLRTSSFFFKELEVSTRWNFSLFMILHWETIKSSCKIFEKDHSLCCEKFIYFFSTLSYKSFSPYKNLQMIKFGKQKTKS